MPTIADLYSAEDGKRQSLITRCEKYAGLTLPIICPPNGYDEENLELQTDYQSIGAQAVNNLANKLMLALFAPSRPFFRLEMPDDLKKKLAGADKNATDAITNALAIAEKNAVRVLDQTSSRPKLYEAMKHLIVTGNALLILPDAKRGKVTQDQMRVLGIKRYVVKRNQQGRVVGIIIKECIKFDELADPIKQYLKQKKAAQYAKLDDNWNKDCPTVDHYVAVKWDGKRYQMTQGVDDLDLPQDKYGGQYNDNDLPYRALTWDLADDNNYGTGLVEQASGALSAISTISEAALQAAILASEFRWLVNPAGQTKVEDFTSSVNGAALPGMESDISLLQATNVSASLSEMNAINSTYVNQIGHMFLMLNSVIRDSERTTAEEVALTANELETSLGGVYSRIALDLQKPIAYWLIRMLDVSLNGTQLEPTIVTGLDALSRNGDVENLRAFLQDLSLINALPPVVQNRLKLQAVMSVLASARGFAPNDYVMSDDEANAEQQRIAGLQAGIDAAPGVASNLTKQG